MTKKQKAGLALVAVAALMLLGSAVTRTWFRDPFFGLGDIGLLSARLCFQGTCETRPLGELIDSPDDRYGAFLLAARITFGLGLVSVALLAVTAFLGFRRHEKVYTIGKLVLMALIITILGALVVMIKKPSQFNPSLGVFLFMVGGMAGVIGAQMLSTPATYEEEERDPSIPRL